MQKLQLPEYCFRTKETNGTRFIFDDTRHKWIVLTPEEWVRQHFIKFLNQEKKFPSALMAIEKQVLVNGLRQRFDLLVYNRRGKPLLVAEFKAPQIMVTQEVFDQAVRYNNSLKAPYVLVSNGIHHFLCFIDYCSSQVNYLNEVPSYEQLIEIPNQPIKI